MRIRSIDTFRGLSIVLMVFFSMTIRLSDSLPDVLTHNEPASLHLGDFVLPMFLFASGMSLVFFHKKRLGRSRAGYALDVVERAGKLTIIWLFLSPFSAGRFLGMDELMLNVVLFIPSVILVRFDEKVIVAVALLPVIAYLVMQEAGSLPDFTTAYLGGFAAAPFYLPVMLSGVIAGKKIDEAGNWKSKTENVWLLALALLITLVLLLLVPPHKMSASPSFMALSVVFSLAVFEFVRRIEFGPLQYVGKDPIRYWVMMFVIFIIPLTFYAYYKGSGLPLGFGWSEAAALSVFCCVALFVVSMAINRIILAMMHLRLLMKL